MRGVWGLLGLVLTLAVVIWLVSQQFRASAPQALPPPQVGASSSGSAPMHAPRPGQQLQSYQHALDNALQPRPLPDEAR